MFIEQLYTACLSQGAYYIESAGEAAIIDPLREIKPYLAKAEKRGVKIKYVFETHFHADFVSGHLDLAKATGAPIIYGPEATPDFNAYIAADGENFALGKLNIRLLHTPGHTMESSCYLLFDEEGKEHALFTGDTLFIGDVGRPDLAQKAAGISKEQLAGTLYRSLRDKIMPLPDELIIYPGHGAGSACGKNMSKETISTLGVQKQSNYALSADMSQEAFVKELTTGLGLPPAYFPMNVRLNREGYDNIEGVLERGLKAMQPEGFAAAMEQEGVLVLDTRKPQAFAGAFVPGALFIGLDGQFAPWAGALIPEGTPLLLVTDEGREEEAVIRLARVGYDNTLGYLKGGIEAWQQAGKAVDTVHSVSAEAFAANYAKEQPLVFDVRREGEYAADHIDAARLAPLDFLEQHLPAMPKEEPFYLHCAGGYRSMIAASILKAKGWRNFTEVAGGFAAIKKTTIPRTASTASL
jgi:hydroxyacylglutathione hydrolase